MTFPRHSITVFFVAAMICASSFPGVAQQKEQAEHTEGVAGAGWLAPGVFATWEAHREAAVNGQGTDTAGEPLTLDLLVLWRGSPGWFDYAQVSASAGAPNGRHGVTSLGRSVELRFDREKRTVSIQRETVSLQGANVLLLDDVDNVNGALISAMREAEPLTTISRKLPGEVPLDPVTELIRQSPELFDFLRCDPAFANANDPGVAVMLGKCSQFR